MYTKVLFYLNFKLINIDTSNTSYVNIYIFLILDYGITTDGKIIYINASSCNLQYLPVNHPIIFDIALPEGFTKTSQQ